MKHPDGYFCPPELMYPEGETPTKKGRSTQHRDETLPPPVLPQMPPPATPPPVSAEPLPDKQVKQAHKEAAAKTKAELE